MLSSSRPAFIRRANRYGTKDSVCNTCFAIVAAAPHENELDRAEQLHNCDPVMLDHWSKLVEEIKRDAGQKPR